MNNKHSYKTYQKEAVLQFLKTHAKEHYTAGDVYAGLKEEGISIGLTTVYRHLERLVKEGSLIKYVIDESSSACYEYQDENHNHDHESYHCKCIQCGKVVHMHCHELNELRSHFQSDHQFSLDLHRTVFYGLCNECKEHQAR